MDTDYLTEEAYDILIRDSSKVSEYLRCDIAIIAQEFNDEDSYLNEILEILKETEKHSFEYLEDWNLSEEVDINKFTKGIQRLIARIINLQEIPYKKRTKSK